MVIQIYLVLIKKFQILRSFASKHQSTPFFVKRLFTPSSTSKISRNPDYKNKITCVRVQC